MSVDKDVIVEDFEDRMFSHTTVHFTFGAKILHSIVLTPDYKLVKLLLQKDTMVIKKNECDHLTVHAFFSITD